LNFAGAFDASKHVRVMGSGTNGWLRQNDAFLPYTVNTAITGLTPLPASSLNGEKQTLAMNWTAVSNVSQNLQLEAKYRHYDYTNHTAVFELTPIAGDVIGANSNATGQAAPGVAETAGRSNPGFNRKTLELSGNYFFTKRSAAKFGWESEWFDRSHRDVARSVENSVFGSVDFSPTRDLLLRVSGRHQNRRPHEYQDEAASDPLTGAEISCTSTSAVFTEEQRCHRRFDEAARILDRGDVLLQYNLAQGRREQSDSAEFCCRDHSSLLSLWSDKRSVVDLQFRHLVRLFAGFVGVRGIQPRELLQADDFPKSDTDIGNCDNFDL
jgi:hypothetical protein